MAGVSHTARVGVTQDQAEAFRCFPAAEKDFNKDAMKKGARRSEVSEVVAADADEAEKWRGFVRLGELGWI
jgi:TPR repeat protein